MNSPIRGTASLEAPVELPNYLSWKHPARDSDIFMNPATSLRLSSAALTGLRKEHPSEVGGLLLGRFASSQGRDSVIVTQATFVESEGLLYNSTASDSASLLSDFSRLANVVDDSKPIGYFRSHLREGLSLSQQDRELIERCFCDPNMIFLVIRPYETGICMAGFFFWKNGRLQTEDSDLEIPLFAPDLVHDCDEPQSHNEDAVAAHTTANSAQLERFAGTPVIPLPANGGYSSIPTITRPTRIRHWKRFGSLWQLSTSLLLVILLAGAFVVFRRTLPGPDLKPAPAPIDLHVGRNASGALELSWNRDLPDLAKVEVATLAIVDGGVFRKVAIDTEQVRSGSFTYFAKSPDIKFQLKLYLASNKSLFGTVRVILPLTASSQASAQSGRPMTKAPSPSTRETERKPAQLLVSAVSSSEHNVAPGLAAAMYPHFDFRSDKDNSVTAADNHGTQSQRRNNEPESQPQQITNSIQPDQAQLSPQTRTTPALNHRTDSIEALNSLQAKGTISSADVLNTEGSLTERLRDVIPPRPIRRVMPQTDWLGRSHVGSETYIKVQVYVSDKGRVIDARAVGAQDSDRLLVSRSIAAARRWVFEPGTLAGNYIAGEYVIIFHFVPQI